jgi:hypothetical protein
MRIRREKPNQIPIAELEELMVYLVNLRFPQVLDLPDTSRFTHAVSNEWKWKPSADEYNEFVSRLREATEKYWPQVWQSGDERALYLLKKLHEYLQLFWEASGADRKRDRDWYIHRAREYYYGLQILPKLQEPPGEQRNIERERLLDLPPERNPIEVALYHLQKRAEWPSTAPRKCPADDCEQPYFLAKKVGQKFCSLECRRPSTLASKKEYAKNRRAK